MLALVLHPSETRRPKHSVRASARRILDSDLITLRFEIDHASEVSCPGVNENPLRRDELWKSTCLECFVGGSSTAYTEWNFAPNGDWAAYDFENYRAGMRNIESEFPTVERTSVGDRARFQIDLALGENIAADTLSLSLTAVVFEKGDEKPFYWALAHCGAKPDFHLRESFTLELGS